MDKLSDKKAEMIKRADIRCGICGKPSVEFDSWFNWYPCENHKHLTPAAYSRLVTKNY